MTTEMLSKGIGSNSYSIPDLVSLSLEGAIRVPSFQRSFVWDAADVRDLFDSLYRGFPIGTILLWRRKGQKGGVDLGPISLEVDERDSALWVVDGQQRITSLVGALARNFAGLDDRFEVYFDLEAQRFVNPRRGITTPRAIPVREALETKTLLTWLRHNAEDLEGDDFDLADRLGGALRDYRIPAYIVAGENQRLLREVFDRVNSAGKPISRAQVFHALFASDDSEPGSPSSVIEELRQLGFGSLDENRIVQSLLAIRGGNVQRDLHGEFEDDEDPADWYDRTEQALARSIDFLRSEGVPHLLLSPNTLPLPILAAFFYLHPDPQEWTLRLLSRWVWRGWTHGFGREGGQTPILRRAISSINPLKGRPDEAPGEYEAVKALLNYVPDHPAPSLPKREFSTNRANSRLILLSLLTLNPLGPDGTQIDIAQQFEKYGADAVTEIVRGRRTYAALRSFWPSGSIALHKIDDQRVLDSHGIDELTAQDLRSGNTERFIARREETIGKIVFDYLDSRIQPRSTVRPSLNDLLVKGLGEDD